MAPCPPPRVLEAFAAGACADEAVGAHVGACEACRAAVEESRENNTFIAGVRTVLAAHAAPGPGPGQATGPVEPGLVSGYEIQEEIHRGGQGVVYRAVQTRTRRAVAIKVLLGGRSASGRQKERFEREIRIAAGLRHPNIVTVHDSGFISDGRYGLVMEYIEGVPLDHWSRSLERARGRDARRAALRERLGVMVKVCDAVLCAHQHSIVHRDLKPANILVDVSGEPHILDFGIARDLGPLQHTRLTYTGEFAGTLAYASPEQVCGDLSRVDTRTDIYSLGVIMYELVSGRMPYAVDGPMSRTLRSIESAEPVPLPRLTRGPEGAWVDGEVSTIILKAMAKDPARRYQTAAALRDDLVHYLAGEAIEARRDSRWYVLRKTAARHRIFVSAAALIMVMLAAFGGAMAWEAHRLNVRGRELADALSASNVERGRSLAAAGNTPLAEDTVFPELIRAGVTRIDGPEAGFVGSPGALHAYWGLWDVFRSSRCVATLRGHDEIKLLYFDQDGQRLNAVDNGGKLTSWSVATWQPERDAPLFAPIDRVDFRVVPAPGGSIAVFGGGLIRIINPETGAVETQADDPDDQAVVGSFSPDGTLLATIGRGNRLRVRDARSLAAVVTMADDAPGDPNGPPWSKPVFSLDGKRIAGARSGGSLRLWNTASGALERTLHPPAALQAKFGAVAFVDRLAFAPDGTIVGQYAWNLVVWPGNGGNPVDLGSFGSKIYGIAFLPGSEGRLLATTGGAPGGGAGVTVIWDLATRGRVATFNHPSFTKVFAPSPDARLFAVGATDGMVQVYGVPAEPHVAVLESSDDNRRVLNTALSPDGRRVALVAAPDGQPGLDVLIIDLKSRVTTSRYHREGGDVERLGFAFAPDGLSLFESDPGGVTMQWDAASGSTVRAFAFPDPVPPEHRRESYDRGYAVGGLNQVRLSPDGSVLARARDDGLIGLWDVASGRWIDWLDSGAAETVVIDFSPDGRTLVAQHPDKLVLWDMQTRRSRRVLATDAFFPAARCAAAGSVIARGVSLRIQFYNTDTGRVLSENTVPSTAAMGMVFHPGGSVFFASGFEGSIRLWDTRTGRELLALQGHTNLIRTLLLTPDGNTLISSDVSGRVLVWDLAYYTDRIARELEYRVSHGAAAVR